MAKNLQSILVIDVEATCWQSDVERNGQLNEIIEIGCALIESDDSLWWHRSTRTYFVKPSTSTIGKFCTDLTGIEPHHVEEKPFLQDVLKKLSHEFTGLKNMTWASYGDYDRKIFERQCKEDKLQYPFGPSHINVKNLFALKKHLPKEVGMDRALEILGIPLEGRHHSGYWDAHNIAKILCWTLNEG